MTESQSSLLLDKAWKYRQAEKFRDSYETLCEAAELAGEPLEKASALLAGIMDLVTLHENVLARKQLDTIKHILANSSADADSDLQQRIRLNLGVKLQEALFLVTDTDSEEKAKAALQAFNVLIRDYGSSLGAPYLKDIRDAIYGERAFLLADTGSFGDALPILQELEFSDPKNPAVIFYLGYCQWSTKNHVLAQKTLRRAIALGLSGNFKFRAHWALGSSLCETGDYGPARVELERARALAGPSDLIHSQIFQWLEYCYKQLGLTDEAANYGLLAKRSQENAV